jgi:hypothetical protein
MTTMKDKAVETATYVAGKVDPYVPSVAKVSRVFFLCVKIN